MTATRDLLIELGTEELPPKALKRLSQAFADGVVSGLQAAELSHGTVRGFAAPRRLAVLVQDLVEAQSDRIAERRGPAVAAAFDDNGEPTPAAQGFARSCGVEVDALETMQTDKGAWLVHRSKEEGKATSELVPGIVRQALERLPIPKRMRWGSLDVQFVRPVHWAVLLFGDEEIRAEILGVQSGRHTRGHRFHHPDPIYVAEPKAYAPVLETEGHVLADFDDRREAIRGQVQEAAASAGGTAVIDDELLDEVTAMVEWPVAVLGRFDERFLEVPAEALVAAMKGHQKYFHVVDSDDRLLPHFITVSNVDSRDLSVVRAGNERVIRPRLADADFFWTQDRKTRLAARTESLRSVVFQNRLGTLYDKVQRITRNVADMVAQLGGTVYPAERAAQLCKCDLMTDMVGEFPELQGTMGRYYAVHDGEPAEVCAAIEDHYRPRFAGDRLPEGEVGAALALADRFDTLVGIFAIGQAPSGDKDPFALRRAALGVVRILIESNLELDLRRCLEVAAQSYESQRAGIVEAGILEAVFEFILARLQPYYDGQGFAYDAIEAVTCLQPTRLNDLDMRLRALAAFRRLPEAESLAAANKRISNILKKTDERIPEKFDPAQLVEPQEQALAEQLRALQAEVGPLFQDRQYEQAMLRLAQLRDPVDRFFDHVMVMAEDAELRANRLALLSELRALFLAVADLSRLQ